MAEDDHGGVFEEINDNEQKLMQAFNDWISKEIADKSRTDYIVWIGHNIIEFDLPILRLRAIKYDLPKLVNVLPATPDREQIRDTIQMFSGTKWKELISLENACKFFDIPVKTELSGDKVYDAYLAGEQEKIKKYCREDVEATKQLYERLR